MYYMYIPQKNGTHESNGTPEVHAATRDINWIVGMRRHTRINSSSFIMQLVSQYWNYIDGLS